MDEEHQRQKAVAVFSAYWFCSTFFFNINVPLFPNTIPENCLVYDIFCDVIPNSFSEYWLTSNSPEGLLIFSFLSQIVPVGSQLR